MLLFSQVGLLNGLGATFDGPCCCEPPLTVALLGCVLFFLLTPPALSFFEGGAYSCGRPFRYVYAYVWGWLAILLLPPRLRGFGLLTSKEDPSQH